MKFIMRSLRSHRSAYYSIGFVACKLRSLRKGCDAPGVTTKTIAERLNADNSPCSPEYLLCSDSAS